MISLQPKIEKGAYIFYTSQHLISAHIDPIATFKEAEGRSYILKKEDADELSISYEEEWAWISLGYQSELSMVGLTAAISKALTEYDIPCNVVAAYHHDHLFVPIEKAEQAWEIIDEIRM